MKKSSSFLFRIRILSLFIIVLACIIIAKLFFVQIVHSGSYMERADKQYAAPAGDVMRRGSIFFSKKDGTLVAAADVSSGFKVAINPKEIEDKESLYESLSPYLSINKDTFISRASKLNDPYEEVITHISKEKADEISALSLPGVSIYKDSWRFYPGGDLASHILGFLAYKGDEKKGQYGLERSYDDVLSKDKDEIYVNFFAEVFSNLSDTFSSSEKRKGDIVTTIEPTVEQVLEQELTSIYEKWNGDEVGGIVIDPTNGDIYAMASMPNFDLNDFTNANSNIFRNPLVENVIELGSVIKPLVMASAIDAKVVTPSTTYYDAGRVVVDKKEIKNFDNKGRGLVTMQTVLDQSLNTGMVFVESKLGHDKFREYMKSFGIGERTGIDLPNETYGLIKNIDSPRNIEYANASFGQGIALTPIGAVRAFSAVANGGGLITPHIVKQIRYDDGFSETKDHPIEKNSLISKESSETVTSMLIHVFENYDGGKYKMEHYSVASKTGTGQVAMESGGGYYIDRHTHSFFGYFPAYNPRFLVFLYIKNPKGANYASQTLIPPFVNITKFLLNYYNVPPDR